MSEAMRDGEEEKGGGGLLITAFAVANLASLLVQPHLIREKICCPKVWSVNIPGALR